MRFLILIFFSITYQNSFSYEHRSLIPSSLRKKLCKADDTLALCRFEVKVEAPPAFSKYSICSDNPHLRLCQWFFNKKTSEAAPVTTTESPSISLTNDTLETTDSSDTPLISQLLNSTEVQTAGNSTEVSEHF